MRILKEKNIPDDSNQPLTDASTSREVNGTHENSNQSMDASSSQQVCGSTYKNSMDLNLYKAVKKGDVDEFISVLERVSAEKQLHVNAIFFQLSPLKNTYLHVAASFGNEDVAVFMVDHFCDLLTLKNHKGDTALHVAARAGHLGVVVEILDGFAKNKARWRRDGLENTYGSRAKNDEGNTPLLEAMINNHDKVVDYLLYDLETAYYVNNEGKSPLYLAVEAGHVENVKTMLNYSSPNPNILDERLKKGKSLIHAAKMGLNEVMLKVIATRISLKDEDRWSLLHCAASIGFLEGVRYLVNERCMDIFETDKDGFYPIHIASRNGHVEVIQELLQHSPDAREFLSQRGQNILHVAAKYGKNNVVKYILKTPGLEMVINERDKDGNTPLHLATTNWRPKVVSSLTWDKRVNLKLMNNKGLTALDAAEKYIEAMASYRKRLTWMALRSAGAPKSKLQNTLKVKSAKYEPYNIDYCKDRVNTLLLVSTLVATVTFAAGFTMPGGYDSEPNQGMATLVSNHKFQVFVICDTIAMYSSIIVAVTLIWAQLGDLNLVVNALRLAIPLLGISLTMMSLAFMASVYLVVSKLIWLSHVVLIMGIIFLAILLTLFLPLYLPYTSNGLIYRYITYYPLCLLMLASGSYSDHDQEG